MGDERADALEAARAVLRERERLLDEARSAMGSSTARMCDAIVEELEELARQRAEIANEAREEYAVRMQQLIEAIAAVDAQSAATQDAILDFQQRSAAKEDQYTADIARMNEEAKRIQKMTAEAKDQRTKQIAALEAEVEAAENDFAAKIEATARLAEKLRQSLQTTRQRKIEMMQAEKNRSAERTRLLKENSMIRRRLFLLENEVKRAKGSVFGLRKEVSGEVGPRRTTSLFL